MITKLHIPLENQKDFLTACNNDGIQAELEGMTDSSYYYSIELKDYQIHKLFYLGWTFGLETTKRLVNGTE